MWKKATHKCSRVEGGLSGPSKLQGPVSEPNSASCNGQLSSGSLHRQARRNSLSGDVCNPVEDHDMVTSFSHNTESQTHPRVSECDRRPSVQVEPSTVNRMVTASAGVQTDLSQVVHTSCRSICHSSEPQISTIRVSNPRPKCLGHRCSEHRLDGSHCLCLPSDGSPSQGDPKNQAMPLPDHRDSPRLARDALVLGPSAALNRDPTATPGVNNSPQTVPQLCVPQQSSTSQPPRLVSRSGQLQEQGFSVEVAERIAAPQRSSTRTIYKSKWALFEKWCRENSWDFFMYLYQDLNRRPTTIDGYRAAIVDTLDPAGHHIAQSSDIHRLLSSFHRDRPKSSRNLPKWNLSVVLNELTKAPIEPMKDTDLKLSYCFLASFGLQQAPQRDPCLGCKQSIQSRPMGKGCEYHLDSALVKPTQERWLKLQDLVLRLKSKHVLTARCLMSLIGLLASTEKMVPEGRLHMRPFQFHLKEHWKYPQSLDNLLPWTETISAHLDWWQNPSNVIIGADLHPKRHSIQLFTDASNVGWGTLLDQISTKGLWSDVEKRLHINVLELKAVSLALRNFKDQCQNQTVLVATDNSTVVAYIDKQGGTHSAEMCAILWKIMTW